MEQVRQIEADKTTKKDIFDALGPPKAIALKDEVSIFPTEKIAGQGRMTPAIYDSSIPIHEFSTTLPYYKADSDTLFELFSKDRDFTEHYLVYYYSDAVPRRAVYEPESRLWLLINEKTGIVEDYVFRKHYNVVTDKRFVDVRPSSTGPLTAFEEEERRKKPVKRNYWYIGVGITKGELSSDNPAFDGIDGSGGYLTGGITSGRFSMEAGVGVFNDFRTKAPVPDPYYPVDDASYSFFNLGIKFDLLDIDRMMVTPWVGYEWSHQDYGLSNYVYSMQGTTTAPVIGVDVRLTNWLILRAAKRKYSFTAEETWFGGNRSDMDADIYTFNTVFRFRMW